MLALIYGLSYFCLAAIALAKNGHEKNWGVWVCAPLVLLIGLGYVAMGMDELV